MQTRRSFIANSSLVLAGMGLGIQPLSALSIHQRRQSPTTWLPERADDASLSALALQAIDAARGAGATFADIRLGDRQKLSLGMQTGDVESTIEVNSARGYGIRVLVDGVWGTASGVTLTLDHITSSAREAVAHAKYQARAQRSEIVRVELASVPAVTGSWTTPVEIDPFSVPIETQVEQIGALNGVVDRVLNASGITFFDWVAETRIIASTEGTLIIQKVNRALPFIAVKQQPMPNFGYASGGFEVVLEPMLLEKVKAYADEIVRWLSYPIVPFDVGRYPVVFQGSAAAPYVHLLAQACEADRVLGLEGDASGTSFLTRDSLGTVAFSPLLTLEVTPTKKASTSWQWDDEGVGLTPYPLVTRGCVTKYTATRDTAPLLSSSNTDVLPASNALQGGLLATTPDAVPMPMAAEVTLQSAATRASLDDLTRGIANGLLVVCETGLDPDPGLSTSLMTSGIMLHVRHGNIVGRVEKMGILARTPRMWKGGLVAVGDTSTKQTRGMVAYKGMPWQRLNTVITAPAVYLKDADVINLIRIS